MGHACFSITFPSFACRFSLENGPHSYIGIMEQAREENDAKFDANLCILPLSEQKIDFFAPLSSFSTFVPSEKVVDRPLPLNFDYSYIHFDAENQKFCLFF